jgi:hypothetical protein
LHLPKAPAIILISAALSEPTKRKIQMNSSPSDLLRSINAGDDAELLRWLPSGLSLKDAKDFRELCGSDLIDILIDDNRFAETLALLP